MECKEAMRLIPAWLDQKLDPETEKKFLEHIEGCGECADELELYFTLHKSLAELDSGDYSVGDMRRALQSEIRHRYEVIEMAERLQGIRWVLGSLAFWATLGALVFQVSGWAVNGLF